MPEGPDWLRGITPYLVFLLFVATLGPLQFGFHLAELNAPEDVITCKKSSIRDIVLRLLTRSPHEGTKGSDCIPMTKAVFASVSSIFTLGGMAGALGAGPVTSKKGRLFAMRMTALIFLTGSVIETLASHASVLGLGRLINGVGAGAATVIVPLFISEVAPPASRGFFGAFTQIGTNVGILATQSLGYFLSYGSAWRWIMGSGAIIAGLHGFGLLAVPESPAWLAAHKGDVTKGRAILQRIRGSKFTIDDEIASWGARIDDPDSVVAAVIGEHQGLLSPSADTETGVPPSHAAKLGRFLTVGFMQAIRDPFYRPAIVSVVGIMFAQQICGINSIVMYSVSLLEGLLPISSTILTIIVSAANLITTVAASPLPDRLGRKTCLLLSIFGQGSSSLGLALSILFGLKTLSAVFVLLFVASFALGLGPVPFIMASELVGQEAVGAVQSWSLAANYLATFLVAQFFPIVNDALNEFFDGAGYVYFLFASFAAFWFVFISIYVPETLGKKDADEVWGRTRRID